MSYKNAPLVHFSKAILDSSSVYLLSTTKAQTASSLERHEKK